MSLEPHHNMSLEEMDKRSLFHPFTSIGDHLANGPRIMSSASGVHVTDSKGRRYLDGAAGLWCVNVGYGRQEIVDAMTRQAQALPFFHSFTSIANEPSIRLADRVLRWAPDHMSKVFFGNSGSDANDTNIKLVWYYNNMRGKPAKKKIIARNRAYHGVTIGAGSLTGLTNCHQFFDLPLPQIIRTHSVDQYREKPEGMSEAEFTAYLASELEALILKEGPDTVAAFIAEPVMGTGGVLVPPEGYFPAMQQVLDRYDILMIADEVICGFGRLGSPFGTTHFGIRPDIMTMAKGLSSGYQPISASVISDRIWDVLKDTSGEVASFAHGFTYSAHPLAAAAALENLRIIEAEGLVTRVREDIGPYLQKRWMALGDHPLVGEARMTGLMGALELVPNKPSRKEAFPDTGKVGTIARDFSFRNGLVMRAVRDSLILSPPLTLTHDEADHLIAVATKTLDDTLAEVKRLGLKQ